MKNKQYYLGPVLIGGVVAGILSAIPFVNYCNFIFCMWMLLGAGLAVKLVQDKCNTVEMGEGAVIGGLTGLLTGALFGALYLLMFGIFGAAMIPGAASGEVEGAAGGIGMMILIGVGSCFGSLLVFGLFGALGGVLGAAIFKPKVDVGGGGFGGGAPPGGGFGQPPGGPGAYGPPAGSFGTPPPGGGFPGGGGGYPPAGGAPPGGGFPPPGGGGNPSGGGW